MEEDTIAAISTPLGEGGIGIVRLSGPEAYTIADSLFDSSRAGRDNYPQPRKLYHGFISDKSGNTIDEVLVAFMPAPYTYTREDIVEINCHSGIITLRVIFKLLLEAGARSAEPGEFTRRAFINGRIDLTQAEAVINMVRARSEEAIRAAARMMQGELSRNINQIRSQIITLRAPIEASFDYPEELDTEEHLPDPEDLKGRIEEIRLELEKMLAGVQRNRAYQEGVAVAIIGRPNVGKSSLLNALLKRQRAIVHEIPGTTRDILEGHLNLAGYPIVLIDTAGIQGSADPVEQEGIARTRRAAQEAKLLLMVFDGAAELSKEDIEICSLTDANQGTVIVINKSDLEQKLTTADFEKILPHAEIVHTSALKQEGIAMLEEAVGRQLDLLFDAGYDCGDVFSMRHEAIIETASGHLKSAAEVVSYQPLEMVSLELQSAWEKLGEITGETISDNLLDIIFSEFCLGK